MEQEMQILVLISIVCFGSVSVIGTVAAYDHFTVIQPKAEAQMEMFQDFTCDDWLSFPIEALVYTKENRDYLADETFWCNEAKRIASEKAQAKLNALLADPNSFESLKRDEKKYGLLLNATLKNYTSHIIGIDQLELLIDGYVENLTRAENKLNAFS